jgi:uncharacterized membrane protein
MRLNPTEKNALEAVEYLLWTSKVKVSSIGLKEDMVMHPDFPSMTSVSDALKEWQVPNMAVRLQAAQLKEIPLPSLVYLNLRGGILATIKSVTNDTVEWLDTKRGWQKESLLDFEKKWNGVTLLLEPNEKSGEVGYSEKIKGQFVNNARTPFLILGTVFCLVIIFGLNWSTFQSVNSVVRLLLGTKFLGIIIGGILLWQSLDADNPFLQNICRLSSQSNCNGILQSNASKITSWLSWSEVGAIYFSGGFLALLFALLTENFSLLPYLSLLSLAALPYTLYSIWYQRYVAKEWCILCMLVQVMLWAESAIVLTHFSEFERVWSIIPLTLMVLAFLIPTLILTLVKKPLAESSQLFDVQRELQRVKFSENYIKAAFNNQSKMPPIFEGMQTAEIGDLAAPHVLTIITNPLCGPCSRLHREINQLLESDSNIRCQFVFLGPTEVWQIAVNFLNPTITNRKELMESWYDNVQQEAEKWIATHKKASSPDEVYQQSTLHTRWCELAGITGTPAVYINGVKLPTAFKIRDIKSIVPLLNWAEDTPLTV